MKKKKITSKIYLVDRIGNEIHKMKINQRKRNNICRAYKKGYITFEEMDFKLSKIKNINFGTILFGE